MLIKKFTISIALTFLCWSCCQAQLNTLDSIKKCLFGDWALMSEHGGGPIISIDTAKHILKVKKGKELISIYQYSVVGDSLFATNNKSTLKARIIFEECDQLNLEFNDSPNPHIAKYRRFRSGL